MGQINIGKPIDTSLIKCCSCGKGYDFKNNIYEDNILVCPHCGLKHKIDFKIFNNKIGNLKKIDRLNLGAIDIGAIRASSNWGAVVTNTTISKANPANASGKLTSLEVFARTGYDMTGVEVATFYNVSGNNFTTRDTYYIGNVAGGAKRTFAIDLDVVAGDYIGIYGTDGRVRANTTDGVGYWNKVGDYIPCTNQTFTDVSDTVAIDLYATGITVPDQVFNVQATDGVYTDKVRVTWNAASGATKYYVWQGSSWVDVGNVTTWDHTGAPAPTITPGTASASDGEHTEHVALSLSGQSANNGSSISYKVKAWNAAGYGPESATNSGYRGVGALTYQWQRSAGDSDANYSNIDGATTPSYNDTGAPADGSGRYYRCVINATGATPQVSTSDRGYRLAPAEFEYVGTGTFNYSGTATISIGFAYAGSGELTYSGTATQIYTWDYLTTASGQLAYSGSAEQVYSKNYLFEGSGELAFSGDAVIIFGLAFVGSGSIAYSGEAVVTYTRDYLSTAVGELIYSGEAIFSYLCNFLFTGSGELAYSGAAICEYTIAGVDFEYVGSGSFNYSGVGIYSLGFAYISSGEFVYSGAAICIYERVYYEYVGSGFFVFSGKAIYPPIYNFLYAVLIAIYANESILLICENESVLSIYCNESDLSIYENKSALSIYENKSILSIEE